MESRGEILAAKSEKIFKSSSVQTTAQIQDAF